MKKFTAKALLFLSVIFILGQVCFAAEEKLPVDIKVILSRRQVTIGEKFKYTVVVSYPKGFEIKLPAFKDKLGDFDVLKSGRNTGGMFGRKKSVLWLQLETFETGKSVIPASTAEYRKNKNADWEKAVIPEATIEIRSLLGKAALARGVQIKDIKGPIGIAFSRYAGVITVILILIVLSSAITAFFLLKKKRHGQAAPRRPAHEIALEQLEGLAVKDLVRQGKIKEYYFEVSGIIRHYLEERFDLRAPEMTTEEFLAHTAGYSHLAAGHKASLKEFLTACDMVKFAKYLPSRQEADAVFESAKNFILQTKEEEAKKK